MKNLQLKKSNLSTSKKTTIEHSIGVDNTMVRLAVTTPEASPPPPPLTSTNHHHSPSLIITNGPTTYVTISTASNSSSDSGIISAGSGVSSTSSSNSPQLSQSSTPPLQQNQSPSILMTTTTNNNHLNGCNGSVTGINGNHIAAAMAHTHLPLPHHIQQATQSVPPPPPQSQQHAENGHGTNGPVFVASTFPSEYYPGEPYYIQHDLTHAPVCTLHGEYGEFSDPF